MAGMVTLPPMTDSPRRLGGRLPLPWLALLCGSLWVWAIWSCAEHWRGNPNYSYGWAVPVLALGFALRRLWNWEPPPETTREGHSTLSRAAGWTMAAAGGALVCGLELARQEMWRPQIVLMLICGLAVSGSLALCAASGGYSLVRAQLFPMLFFWTAVPWPPRLEQPITSTLMGWVAAATAETLHWMGVEAEPSGGAIALRTGLVGITEACSGIRSLQAGIMFGLAIGEWFLLRPAKRVWLLVLAILLAFATNLARTLALSLQGEWHGLAAIDDVHDLIGTITITALIVGIWIAGKLLAPRAAPIPLPPLQEWRRRARELCSRLARRGSPVVASVVLAGLLGFGTARGVYAVMEARSDTQTTAFFVARGAGAGDEFVPVPREIWNELRPTSGAYIRRTATDLPRGQADLYHFFWKPSPWNRFTLVHRPDICMPGVGWRLTGAAEPVDVDFEGQSVRYYAFRFERGTYRALQLWGVWRNGEPVPLEYEAAQVLGDAVPPLGLALEGKRRSATEIVACTLISAEEPPALEMGVAVLRSVFQYRPL